MTLAVTNLSRVLYADPSGDPFTQRRYTVNSSTINPRSIIRQFAPLVGEVVLYNPHDCTRIGDDAATTFTLDDDGVPTIIGVDGGWGIKYGAFDCTITFRGVEFTVQVAHYEDATMMATWDFPPQDAEGFSIVEPEATQVIYYIDPTGGNDGTAITYTGAAPPTGGWEQPTDELAYQNIDTVIPLKAAGDWILLKRGEVFWPTGKYGVTPGTDPTKPTGLLAYGDPALPRPSIRTSLNVDSKALTTTGLKNLIVKGIEVYSTDRDPNHAEWVGDWNNVVTTMGGWDVYGGGSSYLAENVLIEDNAWRFTGSGISIGGNATYDNIIIRRNTIQETYGAVNQSISGFTISGSPQEFPIYFGENTIYHAGGYFPQVNLTSTATSGTATTLVDPTQDFPQGNSWKGLTVIHGVSGFQGVIESITGDEITYVGAADFTGGGDYEIDPPYWSQANVYSHNWYCSGLSRAVCESNWSIDASAAAWKWTSSSVNPSDDLTQRWNVSMGNKIGLGWGGNNPTGAERFYDSRVMENVDIEGGAADGSGQNISLAMGASDWLRGIAALNLIKDTHPRVKSTFYGMRIAYIQTESSFICNKLVNLGLTSSSAVTNGAGGITIPLSGELGPTIPTDVRIIRNEVQMIDTDALTWGDYKTPFTDELTLSGNHYYASRDINETCDIDNVLSSHTELIAASGETGATIDVPLEYKDINFGIIPYQIKRGKTATREAFLDDLLSQRRGAYDPTLDAKEFWAETKEALIYRPDIKYANITFRLDAVEGADQVIPLPAGFGFAKAAVFVRSGAQGTSINSEYYNANMSVGYTNGVDQVCCSPQLDWDSPSRMHAYGVNSNDTIIQRWQFDRVDQEYTLPAGGIFAVADQITINCSVSLDAIPVNERQKWVTVFVWGGDDIEEVFVGDQTLGDTTDVVEKTGIGKTVDLIYMSSVDEVDPNLEPDTNQGKDCRFSHGIVLHDKGTITQKGLAFGTQIANPTPSGASECTATVYNDRPLASLSDGGATIWDARVTAITADGWHTQTSDSANNSLYQYMAIKFKQRPSMALVDMTYPSTGSMALDVGFKSSTIYAVAQIGPAAYNTPEDITQTSLFSSITDTEIFTSGLSATDGQSPIFSQGSISMSSDFIGARINDGIGTSDLDKTQLIKSSTYEITDTQLLVDFEVNPATDVLGWAFCVGDVK